MHVDMDAFFASVEILDNPDYKGKPVIVGGRKDSPRGVVSAASYEARKFGVRSAMPISKAVVLCPHGIFVPGRMDRYQEISRQIHDLFPQVSPLIEPLSIDEAFLDMSGCEHFYTSLEDMGLHLKKLIKQETGLTASVGIAPNKFLAKLASDWRKPDGLFVIRPEDVQKFLYELPVNKIWGVGKKSEERLHQLGLYHVKDILPHSLEWLQKNVGEALGNQIYHLARGLDERPVVANQKAKSIGQETTFSEDQESLPFLRHQLAQMSENVGWRLREQGFYARTVSIKVRFHNFKTITRSHSLNYSFNDDDTIFSEALQLLNDIKLQPIRLLGVTVSNFSVGSQLSLFSSEDQPKGQVSEVMDIINRKFAPGTITKGRTLPNK